MFAFPTPPPDWRPPPHDDNDNDNNDNTDSELTKRALSLDDEGKRTFLGFAPAGYVSVRLLKWMSLFVNGGCDLYFGARKYFLSNEFNRIEVYNYRLAQHRISIGVTFWFVNR